MLLEVNLEFSFQKMTEIANYCNKFVKLANENTIDRGQMFKDCATVTGSNEVPLSDHVWYR